jgi:hypothetical protein
MVADFPSSATLPSDHSQQVHATSAAFAVIKQPKTVVKQIANVKMTESNLFKDFFVMISQSPFRYSCIIILFCAPAQQENIDRRALPFFHYI